MAEAKLQVAFPRRAPTWVYICVVAIFILGTGLRFVDFTDLPLDYFPQRQLRGAIIARSIYYQLLPSVDPSLRDRAVSMANMMDRNEPPVYEGLVAVTYFATGGEQLWVARLYAILFWLLGGIALYVLAARLTSPLATVATLIFYFFLPWSVIFGRVFEPDLPMMMLTLWCAYTLYRWGEFHTWKWAILSGVLGGFATFIKLPAIFPIFLMLVGIALVTLGFKKAVMNAQAWVMAGIFIIPSAIYYSVYVTSGSLEYISYTIGLLSNLIQPSFYIRWIIFAGGLVDLGIAFLSFLGLWLLPKRDRIIPLGLWAGYLLYGFAFPHHIITHEYYSIPLIPAIALSLAPLAELFFNHVKNRDQFSKWAVAAILIFAVSYSSWMSRSILLSKNYRNEAAGWQKLGQALPKEGRIIGITHEDGYRIMYFGLRFVSPWPYTAEDEAALGTTDQMSKFSSLFKDATAGRDYFVVTLFSQFDAQPLLKSYLYDHYPVYAQGDGYLIFDLTQPMETQP